MTSPPHYLDLRGIPVAMDLAADSAAVPQKFNPSAEQERRAMNTFLSSADGRGLLIWLLMQYYKPGAAGGDDERFFALIDLIEALPAAPRRYWDSFELLVLAPGFLAAAPFLNVTALLRLLDWRHSKPPYARYRVCGAKVSMLRELHP